MSTKKNSLASQALLEMNTIKEAIKDESKNTLKAIMSEAVKDALRDTITDDEDEKDYEVEEPETEQNTDADKDNEATETKETEVETEEVPEEEDADEWAEFDKYKTGDEGTYDLTSEKDFGTVLKAYKLMSDDDPIVIKKDGDKVQIKDDEAGTEYIIDLGSEAEGGEDTSLNEEYELELDDDDEIPANDLTDDELAAMEPENDDFSASLDDIEEPSDDEIEDVDPDELLKGWDDIDSPAGFDFDDELYENKKNNSKKTMKENKKAKKEMLFEVDLGYTDNYQDKDPIKGLSNNEPSKSGRSWHKGVPTGTAKPWAGETKSKGNPFKDTQKVEGSVNEEELGDEVLVDNEIEEGTNIGGAVQQRSNSKSHIHTCRKGNLPDVTRHASVDGEYHERLEEMKKIQKENKELKKAIASLRKDLNEAYVTNVNLGKITKLFLENTTSQSEKKDIVNRFVNEAKTVEQSKALYESISRELKGTPKKNPTLNESSMSVNSTPINEQKVVVSDEFEKMKDLIRRMGN